MTDRATITITCPAPDRAALEKLVAAFAEAVQGRGRVEYTGATQIRAPRPLNDEEQLAAGEGAAALKVAIDAAAAERAAKAQAARDAEAAKAAEIAAREAADAAERERQRLEDEKRAVEAAKEP